MQQQQQKKSLPKSMFFFEHHRPSEKLGFPHWPNKVVGSIITSIKNQMGEVGMISKNGRSCYQQTRKLKKMMQHSKKLKQVESLPPNLHPQWPICQGFSAPNRWRLSTINNTFSDLFVGLWKVHQWGSLQNH